MVRVLIAYPTSGDVDPWFAKSLAEGMLELYINPPCDVSLALMFVDGSILPANREDIAETSVEHADVLITIDTDIRFPKEAFGRLIAHFLDGKRVVAANYAIRREPFRPTAFKDGKCVYQGEGVEQVDHVGLGLTLIDTKIFPLLEKPWFEFTWDKVWKGEDVNFFRKVREAGIEVWLDHMIGITHIGAFDFDLAMAEAFREQKGQLHTQTEGRLHAQTEGCGYEEGQGSRSEGEILRAVHEGLPQTLGGRPDQRQGDAAPGREERALSRFKRNGGATESLSGESRDLLKNSGNGVCRSDPEGTPGGDR